MKLSEHAGRTQELCGERAEDIHKWIDGFFDRESFQDFLQSGNKEGYDPYDHRKHRHCSEALEYALEEFQGKYPRNIIEKVFECHIRDDYNGYYPSREDFENGTFAEKYHESGIREQEEKILSEEELVHYFKGKTYSRIQMLKKKHSGKFRFRIVIPTILAMILFFLSIYLVILPFFKKSIIDRKKEMIRQLTLSASSLITHYIHLEKLGKLTREEAQAEAIYSIKEMRYGEDHKEYFWITDWEPRMVMHPYRTELTGLSLSKYKDKEDKSGKLLFVEFVDMVKKHGDGYLEYLWQFKDQTKNIAPKLSYVKGIPEWGWIIGTGVYIHDVEEILGKLTNELLRAFGVMSLFLLIIQIYIILQSRKIEEERLKAEKGLLEAKERYRALVEASNEGYILESEGKHLFVNPVLQRMLGYSEESLLKRDIWEKLIPVNFDQSETGQKINLLYSGKIQPGEWDTVLQNSRNVPVHVTIRVARIFFPEMNGHIISLRKIASQTPLLSRESVTEDVFLSCYQVRDFMEKIENRQEKSSENSISEEQNLFQAISQLTDSTEAFIWVEDSDRNIIGKFHQNSLLKGLMNLPQAELIKMKSARNLGELIRSLNLYSQQIARLIRAELKPSFLREFIGKGYDACLKRIIEFTRKEMGEPPCEFAFISLGSNARKEMTLFSDQDNALIFADHTDTKKNKAYFLGFSKQVCFMLNEAGFPFCSGGIMAENPKWCLSLQDWKNTFHHWIHNTNPENLLEMNVFFDIHHSYGQENLTRELLLSVSDFLSKKPDFFMHFARNCLFYKPPLNVFGKLKTEKHAGEYKVNLKECFVPLVLFARIYALKYGVLVPETVKRLRQLKENGNLPEETVTEAIMVFDELWKIRFQHQVNSYQELEEIDEELAVARLTELEIYRLENILSRINLFQSRLSYEFLGIPLGTG